MDGCVEWLERCSDWCMKCMVPQEVLEIKEREQESLDELSKNHSNAHQMQIEVEKMQKKMAQMISAASEDGEDAAEKDALQLQIAAQMKKIGLNAQREMALREKLNEVRAKLDKKEDEVKTAAT